MKKALLLLLVIVFVSLPACAQETETVNTVPDVTVVEPQPPQPKQIVDYNAGEKIYTSTIYGYGDLEVTVVGFEKTDWKKRLGGPDIEGMSPTEEIGVLKLIVKNISYVYPAVANNPAGTIFLNEFLDVYDNYGIALFPMRSGWDYGAYECALSSCDVMPGDAIRIATPYVFDTANEQLTVMIGRDKRVVLDVVTP